jgi:hypothetical protein
MLISRFKKKDSPAFSKRGFDPAYWYFVRKSLSAVSAELDFPTVLIRFLEFAFMKIQIGSPGFHIGCDPFQDFL